MLDIVIQVALFVAVIVLIFLPPRYDPAIRISEWLDDKRQSRQNERRKP